MCIIFTDRTRGASVILLLMSLNFLPLTALTLFCIPQLWGSAVKIFSTRQPFFFNCIVWKTLPKLTTNWKMLYSFIANKYCFALIFLYLLVNLLRYFDTVLNNLSIFILIGVIYAVVILLISFCLLLEGRWNQWLLKN